MAEPVVNQAGQAEVDRRGQDWDAGSGGESYWAGPNLEALTPDTAVVGDPDLTLTVTGKGAAHDGQGFVPGCAIYFNGGQEPTTWIDQNTLTTTVRPSTASGAAVVPVTVRNPNGIESDPLDFTFTAVVGPA